MIYLKILLALFFFLFLQSRFAYADDFLYDTFTDTEFTDLASHNGETGGNPTWTRTVSAGATAQIASGGTKAQELGIDATSWADIIATSARPSGNEFDFETVLDFKSAASTGTAITFYFAHDSTHYYRVRWCYCSGDQLWSLVMVDPEGEHSLDTYYQDFSGGDQIGLIVTIKMRNASKEVWLNNDTQIMSSADNTVTQREVAEIYWQGWGTSGAGIFVDSVKGTNVATAAAGHRRGRIF